MSAHILLAFKVNATKIVKISRNMAGNTKALVMAVSMMLLINLYECVSIYFFFRILFIDLDFTC